MRNSIGRVSVLLLIAVSIPSCGPSKSSDTEMAGAPATPATTSAEETTGWTAQVSGTTATLRAVSFADPQHGWAVGDFGTVVHTSDGGASWSPQASGTTHFLNQVHFVDQKHGWAMGTHVLVSTSDGGATWTTRRIAGANPFAGMSFVSATQGWVVSATYDLAVTTDGGATWTDLPGIQGSFQALAFADAQNGWIAGVVGDRAALLRTTDGGATWTASYTATSSTVRFSAIETSGASTAWAIGEREPGGEGEILLRTTDGGQSWQSLSTASSAPMAIRFADASTGWKAGRTIEKTGNGGRTWVVQPAPAGFYFGIAVVDSTVWVVGLNGAILKSAGPAVQ